MARPASRACLYRSETGRQGPKIKQTAGSIGLCHLSQASKMKDEPAQSSPFNLPTLIGREAEYINEVLKGDHASGNGRFTELAQAELKRMLGGGHALLTTSCSTALDMAAILSGVGPGDEVIMPSYTFTSTA